MRKRYLTYKKEYSVSEGVRGWLPPSEEVGRRPIADEEGKRLFVAD